MDVMVDPIKQEEALKKELKEAKSATYKKYEDRLRHIKEVANKDRGEIDSKTAAKKKIDTGSYVITGSIVGAVAGLFVCIPTYHGSGGFGAAFITWVFCIIGGSLAFSAIARSMKNADALMAERKRVDEWEASEIESLDKKLENKLKKLENESAHKKEEHLEKYGMMQRAMSVKFVGSAVAREITDYILEPFKRAIELSDRRPHVARIEVALSFEVFTDRVKCPYGEYNFEIQRVQALNGMDEVAALANAIATAIHTDIITSYPKDISGGEVEPMEIDYEYRSASVKAAMTYRAENAGFVEARSF